jgi:organic hydroperoxide reductase OsmC/OhrA
MVEMDRDSQRMAAAPTREHRYRLTLKWSGNTGAGTQGYRGYSRNCDISAPGKPTLAGSSDPHFRGDATRWNPEELLVASLSACHQLWYLHLCAEAGIIVTAYEDQAEGIMLEGPDGGGKFKRVTLRPHVTVTAGSDRNLALSLHDRAHHLCFIARSVAFTVDHEPAVSIDEHA